MTFTTRRAAERAFLNGKCWQGNNLKFTWVTSSTSSSDISVRENIPSASRCTVDSDVQPAERSVCTGSQASASENREPETSEGNGGAEHMELHEVSESCPTSMPGEDSTKCENTTTSTCSQEEPPKQELSSTTSGENESSDAC